MKITIINGVKDSDYSKEMADIKNQISELKQDNDVDLYNVNELDIHNCTGCWNCWIKNPGECVFDDDMVNIYKSFVKSDYLIFVSALKAGFVQSEIKKVLDRLFATSLPHMTIVKDELHHILRYDKQTKLGLVIVGEDEVDDEQNEILEEFMYRLSLNFNHGTGKFLHYYNPLDEGGFTDEISNI